MAANKGFKISLVLALRLKKRVSNLPEAPKT